MVDKNPRLTLDEAKVQCAQCHNPRIAKDKMKSDDKMMLALGVDSVKEEFDNILNAEHMKNGINCIVCHNIDEIHLDKTVGSEGLRSVKFGTQGTMFGPFDDAVSPYHKTEQREHFSEDSPVLCFVCHYSHKNSKGLEVYFTGLEYDDTLSAEAQEEGCRSCHMSKKSKGVASNYAKNAEKPVSRMIRDHRFASVDNSSILSDHIDINSSVEDNTLHINIANNSPHSIPTGYGLREIILKVLFYNKNNKLINQDQQILSAKWENKKGEATIPHLATKKSSDNRIHAKSNKSYYFTIPNKGVYAKYIISYKFINSTMAKKLGITDKLFLKEYKVKEGKINF